MTASARSALAVSEKYVTLFFSQQQLCSIIGASVCFFNTLVPFCPNWFSRFMQSPVEWLTEAITRLFELLEGFISTFAGAPCGSVVTTSAYSINPRCLAGALISLFGFFFDALLADGMIACRTDVCACHNGIYVKPGGGGDIQNYTFSNAISQNVFGQDGRQPQPCTRSTSVTDAPWWFQTCCNGTAATYILPNGVTKVCLEYNATLGNSFIPKTAPEALSLGCVFSVTFYPVQRRRRCTGCVVLSLLHVHFSLTLAVNVQAPPFPNASPLATTRKPSRALA